MLYKFQAVPPPVISSSKLYTQHRVFVELFSASCCYRWVSWNSPLCNVASCWSCLNKLTIHGPMNVKLTCRHFLDVHSTTSLEANLCTALTRRNRTENYISHNRTTVRHKTQLHISAACI